MIVSPSVLVRTKWELWKDEVTQAEQAKGEKDGDEREMVNGNTLCLGLGTGPGGRRCGDRL